MNDNGQSRKKDDRGQLVREALTLYERPLVRYAQHLVGDLDRARDVVQDTFLKLCSHDLDGSADHTGPWLFAVCRNRALDVLRKENRMNALEEVGTEVLESRDPPPDEMFDQNERTENVLDALDHLPEKQQEVIRLKFQEDLSYKEISQVTGYSTSNVGFLIHTGIQTLRSQMARLEA